MTSGAAAVERVEVAPPDLARAGLRSAVTYVLPWFVFVPVLKLPGTPFSTDDLLPLVITGAGLVLLLWRGRTPRFEIVTAGLLLIALLNLLASIASADSTTASSVVRSVARGFGRFTLDAALVSTITFALRDARDAERVMKAIVAAAVAQSLFCVWAYVADFRGPGGIGMAPSVEWTDLRRVHGTFSTDDTWVSVSSNFLAAYLMACGLLGIGIAEMSHRIVGKIAWYLAALSCVAGIALSYTRTSFIGLTAGFVILALLTRRIRVLVALLLVFSVSLAVVPRLSERLSSFHNDRLALQKAGVTVIAAHPLLGIGEGNYLDVLKSGIEHQYTSSGLALATPHNSVLTASAHAGILAGFVLLLLWLAIIGRGAAYAALSTDRRLRLLFATLTAACVALWLQDQVNDLLFVPKVRTFVWIFAALTVVAARDSRLARQ